jgi:acylphosphatase
MKARAHVHVSGMVQGVFFRYHTQELARRLGVNGWVRNVPGGKVEAVFEGERAAVEEMIEFCRRGPPSARVTDVQVKWEKPKEEFSDFRIKWW